MMNSGGASGSPKLELTLNLSPTRPRPSGAGTMLESPVTRAGSFGYPPSNRLMQEPLAASAAATSMVLVGCPRCLMYVMLLPGTIPRCPICKSTVLVAFLNNEPLVGAQKRSP
ncbi:hypothetical protein SAY87_016589 [Trapa incisa]|uniref:GIR1-like zinc ribbon domain-containing protein n=2 Tax=Trapa TaxID=22665 RepID=A0AAN7M693_TRANT|nr:hypothetical protein SAY87_016589 [Trapa incisa]KAK4790776.1 hypothetical protein SAY86_031189 [Trapa natans]